jgi:hypothetical protein
MNWRAIKAIINGRHLSITIMHNFPPFLPIATRQLIPRILSKSIQAEADKRIN